MTTTNVETSENEELILYKFRSLGSCDHLKYAKKILENGTFLCSRYRDFNDPMEGIYRSASGELAEDIIKKVYDSKNEYVICSFSGMKGFRCPLMWSHYANGFKGIAIELTISRSKVHKVVYADDIATIAIGGKIQQAVKTILTTKLNCWQYENEYRFLEYGGGDQNKIGEVSAVYFGAPYAGIQPSGVRDHSSLEEYKHRVSSLMKVIDGINHNNFRNARNGKKRYIKYRYVFVEKGQVETSDHSGHDGWPKIDIENCREVTGKAALRRDL